MSETFMFLNQKNLQYTIPENQKKVYLHYDVVRTDILKPPQKHLTPAVEDWPNLMNTEIVDTIIVRNDAMMKTMTNENEFKCIIITLQSMTWVPQSVMWTL